MSKSNGSSDSDISMKSIEFLTEAIGDLNVTLNAISNTHKSLIEGNKKVEKAFDKFNREGGGAQASKELAKAVVSALESVRRVDLGMSSTARYNRINKEFEKQLASVLENSFKKIDQNVKDRIYTATSNLEMTGLVQSHKENQKGTKNALLRNVSDNEKLKNIDKDIADKMGIKLDSSIFKLTSFFRTQEKEREKKLKAFGEDLIDGLAKNKFVGGVLNDTFKLIGLMGGKWLSQFGQFGRILGGAFYIAMTTAGPILTELIVKGIGNIVGRGFLALSKTIWSAATTVALASGKGLGNLAYKGGGSLMELGAAVTKGEKLVGVAKVAGGLSAGAVGIGGALWAGKEAVDSWKQGKKGNATTFGVGAGLLGAGGIAGIATLFTAAAAPFVAPLLIIGGVVAGLALVWKKFGKDITDWFKKLFRIKDEEKDEAKTKQDWWQNFVNWVKDAWEHRPKLLGGKGRDDSKTATQQQTGENATVEKVSSLGKGDSSAQLLQGKQKGFGNKHLDIKKMSKADWEKADTLEPVYGSMGEILNLGQMSRKRALEVVQADIKAKGDKSFYEKLDEDLINKGSFGTDIPYAARGTSTKVREMFQKLEEQGFDTSKTKITSAIGTLGSRAKMSPHTYTDSVTGHFSSLGTTIDISALYDKEGKRLSHADLERAGLGYYYLYNKGKDHADHEHISFGKLKWQEEVPKAVSEQHSIEVQQILAQQGQLEDVYNKNIKGKNITEEQANTIYEEELKKRQGIEYQQGTGWVKNTGNKTVSLDPSGSNDFNQVLLTLQRMANNEQ